MTVVSSYISLIRVLRSHMTNAGSNGMCQLLLSTVFPAVMKTIISPVTRKCCLSFLVLNLFTFKMCTFNAGILGLLQSKQSTRIANNASGCTNHSCRSNIIPNLVCTDVSVFKISFNNPNLYMNG